MAPATGEGSGFPRKRTEERNEMRTCQRPGNRQGRPAGGLPCQPAAGGAARLTQVSLGLIHIEFAADNERHPLMQ